MIDSIAMAKPLKWNYGEELSLQLLFEVTRGATSSFLCRSENVIITNA